MYLEDEEDKLSISVAKPVGKQPLRTRRKRRENIFKMRLEKQVVKMELGLR
jgi:hypothetical protein